MMPLIFADALNIPEADLSYAINHRDTDGAITGELPRPGQPDEVAAIIGFLCSDDSRRLNGINIPVDGGLLAARTSHQLSFAL